MQNLTIDVEYPKGTQQRVTVAANSTLGQQLLTGKVTRKQAGTRLVSMLALEQERSRLCNGVPYSPVSGGVK